jgi:hypothetical protein
MTLYGGTIAKGSVVSLLQSAGAVGTLSVATTVGIAFGGAAVAGGAVYGGYELYKRYHEPNETCELSNDSTTPTTSYHDTINSYDSSYYQALNKYKNYVYVGIKSKM